MEVKYGFLLLSSLIVLTMFDIIDNERIFRLSSLDSSVGRAVRSPVRGMLIFKINFNSNQKGKGNDVI